MAIAPHSYSYAGFRSVGQAERPATFTLPAAGPTVLSASFMSGIKQMFPAQRNGGKEKRGISCSPLISGLPNT